MVVGADVGLDRARPAAGRAGGRRRRPGSPAPAAPGCARRGRRSRAGRWPTSRSPAPAGCWPPRPGRPSRRRRTRRRRRRRGCRPGRRPAGRGRSARGRAGRARGRPARAAARACRRRRRPRRRPAGRGRRWTAPRRRRRPSRAASASMSGTGASRSARRGVRQRSSATRSSAARPGAGRELGQHGQRRAADRRRGVPDQVGGQRVDRLAGDVPLPDQRGQPHAGQPARGQRRPAVGQVLLAPDVVAAGGQPLVAVRAADVEQPGRVGQLEQPGRPRGSPTCSSRASRFWSRTPSPPLRSSPAGSSSSSGEQLADPADDLQRRAGGLPVERAPGRGSTTAGSGRSRGGP